jgi:hypothetical protein
MQQRHRIDIIEFSDAIFFLRTINLIELILIPEQACHNLIYNQLMGAEFDTHLRRDFFPGLGGTTKGDTANPEQKLSTPHKP